MKSTPPTSILQPVDSDPDSDDIKAIKVIHSKKTPNESASTSFDQTTNGSDDSESDDNDDNDDDDHSKVAEPSTSLGVVSTILVFAVFYLHFINRSMMSRCSAMCFNLFCSGTPGVEP